MRKLEGMKKLLVFLLTFSMVLSCVPMPVLAEEFCEHHMTHDENCGYSVDAPCTFVCEDCQQAEEPCSHSGGTATCMAKAVCEKCEAAYGELAAHDYGTDADGKCDACGADCTHVEYLEGKCKVCGMDEPAREPVVLTITAWSWADDYEILSDDGTYATLPNGVDWETLKSVLPAAITAMVDGAEVEIPVQWKCDHFPAEGEGQGTYALKAILPEGYALGEEVPALELEVDMGAAEEYYDLNGDGSASSPYEISTSADLHEFVWRANNLNAAACAKLMQDIAYNYDGDNDGSTDRWYAIGSQGKPYTGTFDGNGHTISGLVLQETTGFNSFIRVLGEGGKVTDLTISGSFSGTNDIGGIAGRNSGTISDCTFKGSVNGTTYFVGGIVGKNFGSVTGCRNEGTVSGIEYAGGIVGINEAGSSVSLCSNDAGVSCTRYGGGIAGQNNTTVENCYNKGTVSASGKSSGGIVGVNGGTVTGCLNIASVTSNATSKGGLIGTNNSGAAVRYSCYDVDKCPVNTIGVDSGIKEDCGKYNTSYFQTKKEAVVKLLNRNQSSGAWTTGTTYPVLGSGGVVTPTTYTVTVNNDGNGTGTATPASGAAGTEVTLTAVPNNGYQFKEWQVISGDVTIADNEFTIGKSNVEIKAVFEAVPTTYSITIADTITNGAVAADKLTAAEGEKVTLTVTPNERYKLKLLMADGSDVTTQVINNQYAFSMPAKNVTVSATFQVIEYPVKVQGVMVTALNKSDVLGNGTVSYDPATLTLALNNASISYESGAAIQSTYPDYTLKIVGTGTNTISATGGSGIYVNQQNISISGGAFLISGSTNGIFVQNGSLTIDGAQVKAVGTQNGAYAKNGITVTNGGGLLAVTGNKAVVRGTYTIGAENFATLGVSEGAKLIVESGKTVTVSDYITSSGVIEIQGTLKVPAGSGKNTMSGGTLYIGTKGYQWDAGKNAYVSLEHDWSYRLKTDTTDTVEAYCEECQSTSTGILTISKPTREVYNGPGTTEAALNEYNESVFADVGKILYQKKDGGTAIERPHTDAGTYIASVTVGSGENAVTAFVEYTIAPKPVTLTVTLKTNSKVYDGTTTAEVDTATLVGVLRADNEVGVQYGEAAYNSPNVANATEVHFTGWGITGRRSENYVLSAQPAPVSAAIAAKSLEAAQATLSDNVIFEGEPIPELTVKDGDTTLEKDKDYTVGQTGSNGEFTMTITGIGNYKDDAAVKPTYLVVALPDPDKVKPDDKDAIDAYERYRELNKTYKDAELEKALKKLQEALTDYDIVKQSSRYYVKGSHKKLTFTANGYFGKFTGIEVDGKAVAPKHYTAASGSTIITLKSSYLENLSTGKHTIKVNYTDGSTGGKDIFRINTNSDNPITGDDTHMMLFVGIMMMSIMCLAMMLLCIPKKKGKYQR